LVTNLGLAIAAAPAPAPTTKRLEEEGKNLHEKLVEIKRSLLKK
jgi:hypothetical protein